jgi:uncharacterized protein (TIGR02145 family)
MNKYLLIIIAASVVAFGAGGAQAIWRFTDTRDGKTYKTVKIGTKVWMAENLNFAADGSRCYEDSPDSCAKYGRLYNWEAALKACPAGYHLASDDEWTALVDYAGGEEKAGKMLKSLKGWKSAVGINYYGFSALPSGYGISVSLFNGAGNYCYWWSAAECDAYYASYLYMNNRYERVNRGNLDKAFLLSVRCVKD